MEKLNPKVDAFLGRVRQWREEFEALRKIILDCKLTEAFKWGQPCYTLDGSNIVLMHGFKKYCALLFFKGALLQDTKNIFVQQTKNVQAARQIRFTDVKEIMKLKPVLKAYIQEAINVEKSGLKVELKKTTEFSMPEELQNKLDENPDLSAAFKTLTPGRQRGYLLYFSSAKQARTREARVKKYIQHILNGKGLDD